jgi:hypothetical protein
MTPDIRLNISKSTGAEQTFATAGFEFFQIKFFKVHSEQFKKINCGDPNLEM